MYLFRFVALLFAVLEKSESVALLLSVSQLVEQWLELYPSPLSQRERVAFVEALSDVDRLDETDAVFFEGVDDDLPLLP